MLAEIDLIRDSPLIGLAAFGMYFALLFLVGTLDREKRVQQPLLHLILMQVVFVPVVAWMTWWCYRHPDRLNIPDGWEYDLRLFWPLLAVYDIALIAMYLRRRWWNWGARANRLMERAHRLLAQGRVEEADAAYAKGRWILDHKCGRK